MTPGALAAAVREAWRPPDGDCVACRHFDRDRRLVEAALPGLSALSSTDATVWGANGLCRLRDRVINGARQCSAFDPA